MTLGRHAAWRSVKPTRMRSLCSSVNGVFGYNLVGNRLENVKVTEYLSMPWEVRTVEDLGGISEDHSPSQTLAPVPTRDRGARADRSSPTARHIFGRNDGRLAYRLASERRWHQSSGATPSGCRQAVAGAE